MHGRKLVTSGTVAALAILAIVGGCREASTGPTSVKPQDFASSVKLLSGNQQTGAVGAALGEVLSVKVVDAGGLPVAGATVLWQVRDGGGTVSPAASTTASTGLATVTWTMGTTLGANKAVAILQGNYVLDSVVFTATAKVGPAQKFVKSAGDLQTARVTSVLPQALVVNVKDQFGYPVVGVKVTWAAALFGGTVTPLADSTDASGNVSANWTLGTAAIGQSATATVTGFAPIVFTATATPALSRKILYTAGDLQTAPVGTELATQLRVQVKDSLDNPIAGDAIIWNDSISGGGSVSPLSSVTDASGFATAKWTIGGIPGAQVLRARVTATQKVSFNATGTLAYTQVFAGNYQTCAIATNDRAYCWGYGADGQLGRGTTTSINAPSTPVTSGDPLLGPFLSWRQMGMGASYSCGIDIARQLYCWGRLANTAQVNVPTLKVLTGKTLLFASVSTSDTHSCVLATSGLLACTGSNARGQLGDGTQADQAAVYVIAGPSDTLFSSVVTGGSHTCAFFRYSFADSANTKRPRCWGANGSGQLGRNSITTNGLLVLPVTMPSTSTRFDTTSMVAGSAHTCVLTDSLSTAPGVAYCWGSNGYGQLGKAASAIPDSVPVLVGGVPVFVRLYAGEYHTCGISAAGATWCWGRNDAGQLGLGSRSATALPTTISGVTFRQLALGELHSCGVVGTPSGNATTQSAAGEVRCWGDNEYGQLGLATSGTNNAPVVTPQRVKFQP